MGEFFPEFVRMLFFLFMMATVWQLMVVSSWFSCYTLFFFLCGSLSQTHADQGARLRSVNPSNIPVKSRTCAPSQVM